MENQQKTTVEVHLERLRSIPNPDDGFPWKLRYAGLPDDKPASPKIRSDFARLWTIRDDFLTDDEIERVESVLRQDSSERNVVRILDWMAAQYEERVGGY